MADSLPRKNICPLLDRPCMGLDCKLYLELRGVDPQDKDKDISGWDCAFNWQVQAALDVRKAVTGGLDGVQRATESFRNVHAEVSTTALKMSVAAIGVAARRAPLRMIEDADG